MTWLINRRLLVSLPLTQRLLITPVAGMAQDGLDGNTYISPTAEWSLTFNQDQWEVVSSSSDGETDIFQLQGLMGGAPTAMVTFETSPSDGDSLDGRLLRARRVLEEEYEPSGSVITVAEDESLRPIFRFHGEGSPDVEGDEHWIASYVARHLSDSSQDKIIELDSIGFPDSSRVLIIKAVSEPNDYIERAYDVVEELRASVFNPGMGPQASITASLFGRWTSGGTRPKVLYRSWWG